MNQVILAQVGVVTDDPVMPRRRENVEVHRVFESFRGMGNVAGNDQDFALPNYLFDCLSFVADQEAKCTLSDVRNLLVRMLMAGNNAAFLQFDAREHGLRASNKLAGEQRIELCGSDVGPAGVKQFFSHPKRVPQPWTGAPPTRGDVIK